MGKFLTLYPLDAAEHVRMKKPESTLAAANMMDECMSVRHVHHQVRDHKPYNQHRGLSRTDDSYRRTRSDDKKRDESKEQFDERSEAKSEPKQQSESQPRKNRDKKPFRCYSCNEPGHKSAECP